MDKLVVVGGYSSQSHYDVEVIDLSNNFLSCKKPAEIKLKGRSVGTYLDGRVVVCGGIDANDEVTDLCYEHDGPSDTWMT